MTEPQEFKERSFQKSIKGYNVAEVDDYIDLILEKYTELYEQYRILEEKTSTLHDRLKRFISDEERALAVVDRAKENAEAIIKEAQDKASLITGGINDSCEEILAEYRKKVIVEVNLLCDLQKKTKDFKTAMTNAYNEQILMLRNASVSEGVSLDEESLVGEVLLRAKDRIKQKNMQMPKSSELQRNIVPDSEPVLSEERNFEE